MFNRSILISRLTKNFWPLVIAGLLGLILTLGFTLTLGLLLLKTRSILTFLLIWLISILIIYQRNRSILLMIALTFILLGSLAILFPILVFLILKFQPVGSESGFGLIILMIALLPYFVLAGIGLWLLGLISYLLARKLGRNKNP